MENRCSLTRAQRERDYKYLWQVLNECFPNRGVMQRLGYDWDEIKNECEPAVLNAEDDLEFCRALNQIFKRFDYFAHILLYNGRMFRYCQNMYQAFADGAKEDMDPVAFAPWMEAVHHPESERFYAAFDNSEDAGREFFWKEEPHESKATKVSANREGSTVTCKMLPGDVAYIKVPTLDMLKIANDRPVLFDFYARNKKCKDLIVDIRGNGGGATDYWNKLIVMPTIKQPIEETVYMLFPVSPFNEMYIKASLREKGDFMGAKLQTIDELPKFPNFQKEYLSQVTHFVKTEEIHQPDFEHHFDVERIWLLTDKAVYSSAEQFSVFCKGSKWATIIGERTGGDGVGITPFHAVLPESGLLIRYNGILGLNSDGGSNAEFHTIPDIECDPADALMVCLAHIADLNKAKE